jgi:protein-S-isoprenylcysteine O-methyltransferase Ste14
MEFLNDDRVVLAACTIVAAPIVWNILAHLELRLRLISTLTCGNRLAGCYLLAAWIIGFSTYRSWCFEHVIALYGTDPQLDNPWLRVLGAMAFVFGSLLGLVTWWRLGIKGTCMGDYFGFLFAEPITGFPFNVHSHPMYFGTSMAFVGAALAQASAVGLFLSLLVCIKYYFTSLVEDHFMGQIYAPVKSKSGGDDYQSQKLGTGKKD